jgi:AcrR family transcriptional regulator
MTKKFSNAEANADVAYCTPRSKPRDRIVTTAEELFHRHGIRSVGVDAIAEAAGTNKMTLYRHFGSKDELVVEYLSCKGKKSDEVWAEIEAASPGDPTGQLLYFIRKAAQFIAEDERGCDLANAALELSQTDHPARRVIEEFKAQHRARMTNLCRAAGASQAELLADALSLLIEGARVNRRSLGAGGPSATLVPACEAMIGSFGVDLSGRNLGGPEAPSALES